MVDVTQLPSAFTGTVTDNIAVGPGSYGTFAPFYAAHTHSPGTYTNAVSVVGSST